MSSVLSDLGNLHIVTGVITGSGTDSTMTTNDGSAELTGNGTGDYTVTFGSTFLSAPVVVASPVVATVAATDINEVTVESIATSSVTFIYRTYTQNATVAAAADGNITFAAIGLRNN